MDAKAEGGRDATVISEIAPGLSDHGSPPSLGGEADLAFSTTICPGSFGQADRHERLTLFPSMIPGPQIPLKTLATIPQDLIDEHFLYPDPPDVHVYSIKAGTIWANGIVTAGTRFALMPDGFPSYFRGQISETGHTLPIDILAPDNWPRMVPIHSARPVACVTHPNIVYGHFLLEMLPKIYVLGLLKSLGCVFSVAVSSEMPGWARNFLRLYFEESELLHYDPNMNIVTADSVLMPSMMQTSHNFHAAFNLMVADIQDRVGIGMTGEPGRESRSPSTAAATRLYISRSRIPYHQRLKNEVEVELLMQQMGFSIVHPQELSIQDQIRLFSNATIIVGEYGSALHNTLFSPFGTKIVSIDMYSWYQSAIGRLRQQPHAFVAPSDGKFRHWRSPEGQNRLYSINTDELRKTIDLIEHG